MKILDTHAHLCAESFDKDLEKVIAKASAAGVANIVAVGENLADAEKNIQLAARYNQILPAAGLYPAILDLEQAVAVQNFIRRNVRQLAAIGEVGLDFWAVQDEGGKELQRDIFAGFIDLALETGLVLNVHSRSAGRHAIDMLLAKGALKVQMHAFDGKASNAKAAVEAGYFFSIPPSIVRSRQKQKLVSNLPLSALLLETDSPVLGPDHLVRNEPANAVIGLEAVAELKRVTREEAAELMYENSLLLYGNIGNSG
jgi:TatD DNase family protein